MALWGSRDSFSLTGTVTAVNGSSTVTCSNILLTSEIEVGDSIVIEGVKLKVTSIVSSNTITVDPAWSTANATGVAATGQDSPKFLASRDGTIQGIDKVYGVDSTEAFVQTTDPGWVHVNSYSDMHGVTRTKREVLVAASSYTGDAEDTVYPNTVITINTQPQNSSANTGDPVSFTVVASTLPAGTTINFRWQEDQGAGFVNLTNTGVYSNTSNATLTISDNTELDGYIYRVQLSAAGVSANTVSASATITEV